VTKGRSGNETKTAGDENKKTDGKNEDVDDQFSMDI
jgi:hypothetical protein